MASSSSEAPPSSPREIPTFNNSTKSSIRSLVSNFKAKFHVSKPKLLDENIIHNGSIAASSSVTTNKDDLHNSASSKTGTTNKNDQHGEALPPSSLEKIPDDINLVDSALKNYTDHMNVQINMARKKFEELQNSRSSEKDFDKLRKAIRKLKLQIPTKVNIISTTNKDDYHRGRDLSPSSQMMCSDLLILDSDFAKVKEYMDHTSEKIDQGLVLQ
ncbi:hypothetical protein Vadar_014610 [Vaccinium darrowii]|uniref:Uncharacterized protein n=1 Tax=Vaccinium darrowii TaxID=229202 RepID=A0ACB7YE49_9ERIC|nr:hypothetical protein Vadar_014610 [Vaccinium darrowii]